MSLHHVVVSHRLPEVVVEAMSGFCHIQIADADMGFATSEKVVALVVTAMDSLSADYIAGLPDTIGAIISLGVGTDHIDLGAAAARNILVSNTPVVTEDTADLTMALLLAACRKTSVCEKLLRAGDWSSAQSQLGMRVHGSTLGIVGFGDIGQAVAKRAQGFGMNVIYHGPRPKPEAASNVNAHFCSSLSELLSQADIVSLHCPLTPDTHHLLDKETLSLMRPGSILINTGRGALIDEQALVGALKNRQIAGAGLDVFEFEPAVSEGLLELDNVTLLPHIGSATVACRQDIVACAFTNLRQYLESGLVVNKVECL